MTKRMRAVLSIFALVLIASVAARLIVKYFKDRLPLIPVDPVKIEISSPQSEIVLEKIEAAWRLRRPLDYPADNPVVKSFINDLRSIELGKKLTNRTDSHGEYGVADSSGITVRLHEPGRPRPVALLFGKEKTDFPGGIYVRVLPSPGVFLARGISLSHLERSPLEWRDRRVLALRPNEKIVGVTVAGKSSGYELVSSAGSWQVNGAPADTVRIEAVLSRLRDMTAEDFIAEAETFNLKKWGLDPPQYTIAILLSTEQTVDLQIGFPDKSLNRFPVQRGVGAVLFWVSSDFLQEILNSGPEALQAAR
jgi:hypothetical protein